MLRTKRIYYVSASLLFFFLACSAQASTILSVTGPLDGGFYPISTTQALASSWTETSTYTDVMISALLTNGPAEGTAYLMTHIGPGTTTASEIAEDSFVFPNAPQVESLFTGLTLGPGTYYLVLGSTVSGGPNGGWRDAYDCGTICSYPAPLIVSGAGVSRNTDFISSSVSAYAPASSFIQGDGIHGDPFLQYEVVSTPEPRYMKLLFLFALIGVWTYISSEKFTHS
jgi:hypothetical protein